MSARGATWCKLHWLSQALGAPRREKRRGGPEGRGNKGQSATSDGVHLSAYQSFLGVIALGDLRSGHGLGPPQAWLGWLLVSALA